MKFRLSSLQIAVVVVVVTHLVGAVGYLSPWSEWFLLITPLHLLLSSSLLVWHQADKPKIFWWLIAGLIAAGYFVEVAGINTGVIFGEYEYHTTLGPKIWGTPPIIGINWMMLILGIGSLINHLKAPVLIRAMLGALAMVALDMLIEPVAMKYEFWDWAKSTVPTHNYLGWLITAFILFIGYYLAPFQKRNPLAFTLILMQFVFFGILNLFI